MKRLISLLAGAAVLWAIGFALFVAKLPKPATTSPAATSALGADGVAVYTGGGGIRISTAMALFADGAGQRLLISGVHPDTSAARLSDFWVGPKDRFDCCVDLGRAALTTEGNASELKDWARNHNYQNIILVTSEYHMPRALTVTRARMPDLALTPYPVASGYLNDNGAPASYSALWRLAGEYSKFLLAQIRALMPESGR